MRDYRNLSRRALVILFPERVNHPIQHDQEVRRDSGVLVGGCQLIQISERLAPRRPLLRSENLADKLAELESFAQQCWTGSLDDLVAAMRRARRAWGHRHRNLELVKSASVAGEKS